MQRILAMSFLTVKAAFRFRLVLSLAIILLASVIVLPLVIKDDGTARGVTQILLTYTLSLITALLGAATLWLACGTLARDVEECQIQMVAVKPIPRWQIWLGKWIGILMVNALLLALSAGAVYFLLLWRAQRLPEPQQKVLRDEILIARGSAKPSVPDYEPEVEKELKARVASGRVAAVDVDLLRRQIRERLRAQNQITPPGFRRSWTVNLGLAKNFLHGEPMSLRLKFNAAQPNSSQTYHGFWIVGDLNSPRVMRSPELSLSADTFHEFAIPPDMFDENGNLQIHFVNTDDTVLLFPEEDGVEVLYREGGFALNYVRGVGIIFFWLAFLAAVGLMASSFLSFPVAAFFSLGVLMVGMSSGTISLVLQQGTIFEVNHETGMADHKTLIDEFALPLFRALLDLINMVRGFSPIDSLSSGRSVTWSEVGRAFFQIGVVLSGILAAIGITAFTRRELATAQGTQ